jgi:hypothetical protein
MTPCSKTGSLAVATELPADFASPYRRMQPVA